MKYPDIRVVAVVVTHNRPDELRLVVRALQGQVRAPERILVLDNASTVSASNILANFPCVEIIRSEVNSGGAGGFAFGIEGALVHSPEWLWLMDDDAIPRPDALERLLEQLPSLEEKTNQIGALYCAVYEFGKLAPMHRRRFSMSFGWEQFVSLEQYSAGPVQIDTGSFVGCLLSAKAARVVDLPNAEFFLAYDDTEYSLRLANAGYSNWLIPASKIDHLRSASARLRSSPFGLKHFYNIRNRIAVVLQYARWKTPAVCLAILWGVVIWIGCGGARHSKSIRLLFRAINGGLRGKLGKLN
jgi:GT2 family glycosyltransferase